MNWYDKYDLFRDKCRNCGEEAGNHHSRSAACPDHTNQDWSRTHKFHLKDVHPTTTVTTQKPLSKECPCGISRQDCTYHKAS